MIKPKSLCDCTNYPFVDLTPKCDKQNKPKSFKKLSFHVNDLQKYSCGLFSESKRFFNVKIAFSELRSENQDLAENQIDFSRRTHQSEIVIIVIVLTCQSYVKHSRQTICAFVLHKQHFKTLDCSPASLLNTLFRILRYN